MAKKKHRYTRSGGFSGTKAYIRYVEYRKKCHDAVDRSFYAIIFEKDHKGTVNYGLNFH
jgi:hypothetical protein